MVLLRHDRAGERGRPRAVMIENVRGLRDANLSQYRAGIDEHPQEIGYSRQWRLVQASDFGVPQLCSRVIAVGLRVASALSAARGCGEAIA